MAEYYPLLARAVAGLGTSTPEIRRGIYERARKALLGQLTSIVPPVPEEDIQRESQALDAAVEQLEAELAANPPAPPKESVRPPAARVAPPRPPAPPLARPPRPLQSLATKRDDTATKLATGGAAPRPPSATSALAARPSASAAAALAARPALVPREAQPQTSNSPERRPTAPPAARAPEPVAAEALALPVQPNPVQPRPVQPPEPRQVALAPTARETAPIAATAPASLMDNLREFSRPRSTLEPEFDSPVDDDSSSPQITSSSRGDPIRPVAQQHQHIETETRSLRHWIVGAVILMVIAAVAIMAFILRDKPIDLARLAQPAATDAAAQAPGKIIDRIGAGPSLTPQDPQSTQAAAAAPPAAAPALPQPTQAPPAAVAAAPPAAAQPPAVNPALPVAQRAALLIDAPTDAQKVKAYVGTVVWRLDNVAKGAGQPTTVALRADLDIPEAKFKASMIFEINTDDTLPASHTIELRFNSAADSPVPAIQKIDPPDMRAEDAAQGDPLSGAAQQVVPNYFLVALTRGDAATARNIDLLTSRGWMDVPMLLADGRIAKLTFEKGTTGDQALKDALTAWQK